MNNPLKTYPWLLSTLEDLKTNWQTLRSVQSFMFCGAKDIGKHHLCRQLSKIFLCNNQTDTACNNCSSCVAFANYINLDYLEISPKGLTISIDDIRKISDFVVQSSNNDNKKIIYVKDAECLNRHSANAFLKMLEEPNPNCIFVLSTSAQYLLLPTIISRVLRFNISSPNLETTSQWLASNRLEPIENNDMLMLLDYTNNCPLAAQSLTADGGYIVLQDFIMLVGTMLVGKTPPLVNQALVKQTKESPLLCIDIILWLLSNIIYIQQTGAFKNFQTADNAQKKWQFLANSINSHQAFKLQDSTLDIRRLYLQTLSPNVELELNCILCDWHLYQQK